MVGVEEGRGVWRYSTCAQYVVCLKGPDMLRMLWNGKGMREHEGRSI